MSDRLIRVMRRAERRDRVESALGIGQQMTKMRDDRAMRDAQRREREALREQQARERKEMKEFTACEREERRAFREQHAHRKNRKPSIWD